MYPGTWIEGTSSISAEVLTRFAPAVARAHPGAVRGLPARRRDDPLQGDRRRPGIHARSRSSRRSPAPCGTTTCSPAATARTCAACTTRWRATTNGSPTYRDTRGTGGVEAFGTFDTGHDLSPRFWFVPDRPLGDARYVDPTNPILPFVAPDLTANVAAQRSYLARIADELGLDGDPWRAKAAASVDALFAQCWDEADGTFYDRDAQGDLRRVQSDVLLRVMECEIGDDEFFAAVLERYLMHTGKFLAHYGFTSLALDDPRFDANAGRNSWGGPVNFLSLIRAPHPFEHHGRVAELALTAQPVLTALAIGGPVPAVPRPVERRAGLHRAVLAGDPVVPRRRRAPLRDPAPSRRRTVVQRDVSDPARARRLGGGDRLLPRASTASASNSSADDERVVVLRDGEPHVAFPRGWRVVTDAAGEPIAVVGLAAREVTGRLETSSRRARPRRRPERAGRPRDGRPDGARVHPAARLTVS